MRQTVETLRRYHGTLGGAVRGIVRRMVATLWDGTTNRWQLKGVTGREDSETEILPRAELFQHVGFASSPAAGSAPEVVVVHPGGKANHPIVIATRNRASKVAVADGETAIYSDASGALVRITAVGDVIVRAASGRTVTVDDGAGAVALATKDELNELVAYVRNQFDPASGHTHKAVIPAQPTNIVPSITTSTAPLPADANGTVVLRGK